MRGFLPSFEPKVNIVISCSVEGIHCWPECDLEGVEFLRDPHRHYFYIKAKKAVKHDDRDIEIILLKRKVLNYLTNKYGTPCQFGPKSCEMIARELLDKFSLNYCEVLEDNENGAEIYQ